MAQTAPPQGLSTDSAKIVAGASKITNIVTKGEEVIALVFQNTERTDDNKDPDGDKGNKGSSPLMEKSRQNSLSKIYR